MRAILAAILLVLFSTTLAEAKPRKVRVVSAAITCTDRGCSDWAAPAARQRQASVRLERRERVVSVASARRGRQQTVASVGGYGLVDRARSYMGTNPTGWNRVWCGRFMAMIAPDSAAQLDNPNWAREWADLPRTSARVGAIAVLRRGRGGHVGVVSGFDASGNPIIISGNHGRRVGEGVYPARRVIAYVSPA